MNIKLNINGGLLWTIAFILFVFKIFGANISWWIILLPVFYPFIPFAIGILILILMPKRNRKDNI